ncbi:PAS domain-containing protein [Hyalangium gracile]|uniref:PAS domain-containing protein n=1 Tax=Hyalangium gracile TaxID=394092 RepID=UPI001CCD2D03|nr:PAS domain-containing protein [Hyalangium gracile]
MTGPGASPPSLEVVEGITEEQSCFFLETMVACAPVGLAFVDVALRFIHVNDTLAAYNGLPRSAHLGHQVKDVIPQLWELVEPHYRQVLEQETPILNLRISGETRREPGVRHTWSCSYYPVRDRGGSLCGIGTIVTDITEQCRAEEALASTERALRQTTAALQRSEERYRTFINQSTEGIWRMELVPPIPVSLPEDAQIEAMFGTAYLAECNSAMARMHGLQAPTSSVGRRLDQFLTRTSQRDTEYLRAFIRSGYRLESSESREVSRDGSLKVFLSCLVGVVENGLLVRAWGTQRDVTEQTLARMALESSQEEARHHAWQLRVITDSLPALVTYIDRDERVLFCNQTHETWFGLKPEQLMGKTVREIFLDQYARVRDWTRRALDGETLSYEAAYTRKDGQQIHVQATYVPRRDEQGQVQGFVAHLHDVTDRKLAEAELEAQRSRLHDILIHCPASICILSGPRQVFTLVNPIFQRLAGGRALLGTSLMDALPTPEARAFSEKVRRVYETGEPLFEKEAPLRVVSGEGWANERLFNFLLHPLRDARGDVDSVMAFAIDVTEEVQARRKVEEWAAQLSHQERWLRSVLDFMPVALLLLEPDSGRVLFANRHAHRMAGGTFPLGVPASAYDSAYHLLDEDGRPIPMDRVPGVRAARGERVQGASLIWVTPVGRYRLHIDSETLPAAHGHPATVLLALQDVSQLKQMQDELQKAVQLRDEFLTVASHELRTPLTPLQLKLQSLVRDCSADLPPEQLRERLRKTVGSATQQVHKLVELIGDLLDVSRLTEGRLSLDIEPVDLSALVRDVVERFEPQALRAGSPLVVQADEPIIGFWDRLRLEQVVDNLLSNALKYGPGRPVTLRVEQHGEEARLTVSDEGIGIPSESLPRIFEKFERAVSPRHYGGLGLGLYITRQIVQALGGGIRVESQPERGATFTVELPMACASPLHEPPASAPPPAPPG